MSLPWGNLRPSVSGHVEVHVASVVLSENIWSCPCPQTWRYRTKLKGAGPGSCSSSGSQWLPLLCFALVVVPCSGSAQPPLLCQGRCTSACLASRSRELETQPVRGWWILGDSAPRFSEVRQCSAVFKARGLSWHRLAAVSEVPLQGVRESGTQAEQQKRFLYRGVLKEKPCPHPGDNALVQQ